MTDKDFESNKNFESNKDSTHCLCHNKMIEKNVFVVSDMSSHIESQYL